MPVGIANLKDKPTVVSGKNVDLSYDGVLIFTGELISSGKITDIFEKGFCWGVDAGNLADTVFLENKSTDPGDFFFQVQNARSNTTYYWRAFAENDFGMTLGEIRTYNTPAVFEADNEFTGKPRSNFTVFTLKNVFYMTCGYYNNAIFSDIWRYNGSRWWNDLSNIPGPERRHAVAFTINDSLAYVGTGSGIEGLYRIAYGDFYRLDATARRWSEIETPPEMPRYEAIAFGLNNKGYIVGGRSPENEAFQDMWEYSIDSGVGIWKKCNDFPNPFYAGVCIYNQERVFAGFGSNSESENILWEYNAVNDEWTEFIAPPIDRQGNPAKIRAGQIIRDKMFLLDAANIIWELDLRTKQYKQKSALPREFPLQNEQYMFSMYDVIYFGLGGTSLFYKYYPFWDN
jgi:hypothetical protein